MRSFEDSLTRLGLNAIDILYIRDLEVTTLGEPGYAHHFSEFLGGGARALEQLKSSGAVKAVGLGVNEVPACLNLLDRVPLDAILLAAATHSWIVQLRRNFWIVAGKPARS